MIFDIIFVGISLFLKFIAVIFSVVTFAIPDNFEIAITYFVGHLNFLRGFLDVETLLQALGVYLSFLGFWYLLKMLRFVWGHMPWVGRHHKLPSIHK